MKRGQKHAHHRTYNRPTRHASAPAPQTSRKRAEAPDWRLRKVLRALAAGGRLVFDRVRQTWYAVKATGGRLKIKRKLMLELLRSKFVNFRLTLTAWGRLAAEAAR